MTTTTLDTPVSGPPPVATRHDHQGVILTTIERAASAYLKGERTPDVPYSASSTSRWREARVGGAGVHVRLAACATPPEAWRGCDVSCIDWKRAAVTVYIEVAKQSPLSRPRSERVRREDQIARSTLR